MTRSVEIPDAAVVAADRAFWEHPASHGQNTAARNRAIRAALVAARPYLVPQLGEIEAAILDARYGTAIELVSDEDQEEAHREALAVAALLNGEIKKGEDR